MENNSDGMTDNISWILEETNPGATESRQGDINKSDADIITGWDSELSEISSSEEDEGNSEINKVSPSMLVRFPNLTISSTGSHFIRL